MSVEKKRTSLEVSESISTLSLVQKLGYGIGHVSNDLCSTVWFSYTLLFFKYVLVMPTEAGSYMMLGQLTDALFSAMVGVLTDLYGTKRNWHIVGSVMVCLSFPLMFILQRNVLPYWGNVFYFSAVITLFQCGWATVQISHLAIIPEYSNTERDRSELNAVRFSMSILSNITVFVVAFAFLHIRDKSSTDQIGPNDFGKFRVSQVTMPDICLWITAIIFPEHYAVFDRLRCTRDNSLPRFAIVRSLQPAGARKERREFIEWRRRGRLI
jgi:Na+/melibiose symporter-like transporter